jgi:hypothetical protein
LKTHGAETPSGILTYFAYWYSMYVYIYIYSSLSNNSCNIVQNILKRRMLISYELVQINLRAWTHMYIYIYTIYHFEFATAFHTNARATPIVAAPRPPPL